MSPSENVDILILGSGWTGTFLFPLLKERRVTYAATTRKGGNATIPFEFDPESDDPKAFEHLPSARTIVIVFPIYKAGGSKRLLDLYNRTHPDTSPVRWIQLGSTGVFDGGPTLDEKRKSPYMDRHSPVNPSNERASAEKELLDLTSPDKNLCTVLNLCGLYGGSRSIRRYVSRIAGTKDLLAAKGSVHMIHGIDVARAILAVHEGKQEVYGQRWLLTDLRVYDWWELASKWGDSGEPGESGRPAKGPQAQWVTELMRERNIRSLPRSAEEIGRALDSREFWEVIGISPSMGGQLE